MGRAGLEGWACGDIHLVFVVHAVGFSTRMYLDGQVFKDITVIAHSDRAMRYHNVYTWRASGSVGKSLSIHCSPPSLHPRRRYGQ